MRVGLFLAYWPWFSPEEQVDLSLLADELGLDSVWISEAWGQDAVSVLGYLAARTERVALGSAVIQIPARKPTAVAMAAATLDVLSGGRVRPGLGASGPQVSAGGMAGATLRVVSGGGFRLGLGLGGPQVWEGGRAGRSCAPGRGRGSTSTSCGGRARASRCSCRCPRTGWGSGSR